MASSVDWIGDLRHPRTRLNRPMEDLLTVEAGVPFDGCILARPVSYQGALGGVAGDCAVTMSSLRNDGTMFTSR